MEDTRNEGTTHMYTTNVYLVCTLTHPLREIALPGGLIDDLDLLFCVCFRYEGSFCLRRFFQCIRERLNKDICTLAAGDIILCGKGCPCLRIT